MKSWAPRIQQHINEWSARLGILDWWPRYVYHFTDVCNAASILNDSILYSRAEAEKHGRMLVDNASPDIMSQTPLAYKHFVRLYFRPKTPTQYRNEGIRPISKRVLGGAHCPIPIYFCFDAENILSLDASEYSNGNMASGRSTHSKEEDFFFQIPFAQVFHSGRFLPEDRDDIVFRRCAEVLIPDQLPLEPYLKFIACRSVAEMQTLINFLNRKARKKWETKLRLGEQGFFHRKWTYVEEVVYTGEESITFRFNPNTETPGPFHLRVEYRETASERVKTLERDIDSLNSSYTIKKPINAESGNLKLYLDDCLAYSDNIIFIEIPF
jgi:hypothetical protein